MTIIPKKSCKYNATDTQNLCTATEYKIKNNEVSLIKSFVQSNYS